MVEVWGTGSMHTWLVTMCVLQTCLVSMVTSCSCEFRHTQSHYCQADFVIKATVKGVQDVYRVTDRLGDGQPRPRREPDEWLYFLKINKVFKGHGKVNITSGIAQLSTSYQESLCGLQPLEKNQKYLITGTVQNQKLYASLCDFVQPFYRLTVWQKKGFTRRYRQSCDCEVSNCYSDDCRLENSSNNCFLDMGRDMHCYLSHSYCRRKDGACSWSKNKHWRGCHRQNSKHTFIEP